MKKAIYILLLVFMASFVSASTIFQDKANWVSCGIEWLDNTSDIPTIKQCSFPDKTMDSNWSSSQIAKQTVNLAYVKPACAVSATWVIKDSAGTHEYPIPAGCFNYKPNVYEEPSNTTVAPYIFLEIAPQGGWEEKGIPADSYMAQCWFDGEPTFGGGGEIVKGEDLGVNVLYEEGIRWETKCPEPELKKATKLSVCYKKKCATLYNSSKSIFTQEGDSVKINFGAYESKLKEFFYKLRELLWG